MSATFQASVSLSLANISRNHYDVKEEDFRQKFERECVEGSAINKALFDAAIKFVQDEGHWEVHEALGLLVRSQWQTRRPHDFGITACFMNEDGSIWHAKPEKPMSFNGKENRYQAPKGNGSKAYRPPVTILQRRLIAARYGISVPETGSFWDWADRTPGLTFCITEGAKKALAMLSMGHIAVALYGVNAGYSVKDEHDNPVKRQLIKCLERLLKNASKVIIVFDQDERDKAKKRVSQAVSRLGWLLSQTKAQVRIARWDSKDGKGIDDVTVRRGQGFATKVLASAITRSGQWVLRRLRTRLKMERNFISETRELDSIDLSKAKASMLTIIQSPKGTGKTKLITKLIKGVVKVLLLGHRISLVQNSCERAGLEYRGDLSRVGGRWVSADGFSSRVGTCLDSILAFDVEEWRGCTLVLDEICQVLRHGVQSSTCNKEGMRPVVLARLKQMVKVAGQIIVADADMDNASIDLLLAWLKEDNAEAPEPYFIYNNPKMEGSKVEFINCPDDSQIMKRIKERAEAGEKIYVATDSLATANVVTEMMHALGVSCLNITSETSGGQIERTFLKNPNENLSGFQVLVASPSMGTGVSIELPYFTHRFGVFKGGSIIDTDMCQMLARVRDNIPMTVWCPEVGSNYSATSTSGSKKVVKESLKDGTNTTAALVMSQLKSDATEAVTRYDWEHEPIINFYAEIAADQNFVMRNLRECLEARLRHEGHDVTVVEMESDKPTKEEGKEIRSTLRQQDEARLIKAPHPTEQEVKALEAKDFLHVDERARLNRYKICEFYAIAPDELTTDLIGLDDKGRFRAPLLIGEEQRHPELAIQRDAASIERQSKHGSGVCPWDISSHSIRREMFKLLGVDDFIDPDKEWTTQDLTEFKAKCLRYRVEIKKAFGYTIKSNDILPQQVLGELLKRMGYATTFRWSRSVPGQEGTKVRVHSLDPVRYQTIQEIFDRRAAKRASGSLDPFIE
jgi:hypothetical protein